MATKSSEEDQAVETLIEELRLARSIQSVDNHPNNPTSSHPDRLAAITALGGVLDFIETIPGARRAKLKLPLQRLWLRLLGGYGR